MQRLNPNEQKPTPIIVRMTADSAKKLNKLAPFGRRSAYIRSLIERAWEEHQQGEQ